MRLFRHRKPAPPGPLQLFQVEIVYAVSSVGHRMLTFEHECWDRAEKISKKICAAITDESTFTVTGPLADNIISGRYITDVTVTYLRPVLGPVKED